MKIKRIIAFVLIAVLLMSAAPVSFAAAGSVVACAEHKFTGGVCSVCGYSMLSKGWSAPDFAEADYSFVAIPDTQGMVDLWPNEYYKQMKWIADNKDGLNIQAVFHMGDMVESNSDGYWGIAKMGTDYLDRAGIVWMPMRGNHDDSGFFNKYYGSFSNKAWFADSFEEGKLDFCAWNFSAGGRDYMVINLGWAPTVLELNWATELAANNPQKNVIVLCHAYMNSDNSLLDWDTDLSSSMKDEFVSMLPEGLPFEMAIKLIPDGEAIWSAFKAYENVVLAMSGHVHSKDIGVFTDSNAAGKPVSSLLIDRQEDDDAEHLGMLAVLSFSEDSDDVRVHWYSTRYDAFWGESFGIVVPHVAEKQHVHSWDEGTVTKQPTEQEEGEKTFVCTGCGEKRRETIEKTEHVHNYSSSVIAPSCTEAGYTEYSCHCGESYKDSETAPLGHIEKLLPGHAPGCSSEGLSEGKICSRCNTVLEEQKSIAPTGHSPKAPAEEKRVESSCVEEGSYESVVYCSVCSGELERASHAIEAKGHSWDEGEVTVKPTVKIEGVKTFTCTVCGEIRTETLEKLPGCDGKHSWNSGRVTKKPTTKTEGEKLFTCTVCEETKTEKIAKLPGADSFGDVKDKDYFYDSVDWAVSKAITNGLSADTFGPGAVCTRAQVVTFLWRAAGEPRPLEAENSFVDVAENAYYHDAVLWALEQGITGGVSDTLFAPDKACTRAQVVTFLWRAAGEPELRGADNPFADVPENAYYRDAVLWALREKITTGLSAESFGPANVCTRAQIVTFLYRFYN